MLKEINTNKFLELVNDVEKSKIDTDKPGDMDVKHTNTCISIATYDTICP